MDYGAIAAIVLLVIIVGFTIWLLWNAFRSQHWAWPWRVLSAIIGLVGCLFLALVFLLAQHALEDARGMRTTLCIVNLNSISRGMQLYGGDNDNLAPLSNWTDGLSGYLMPDSYTCPVSDSPFAFTMSRDFIGAKFPDLTRPKAAVVFDGKGGKNSIGDAASDTVYRHDDDVAHFFGADGVVSWRRKP